MYLTALIFPRAFRALALLVLVGLLTACNGELPETSQQAPTVGVIIASPQLVVVTKELSGRLEPWRIAQVRAQVSGIVKSRDFVEGSDVEAGQQLYQIDPAPYRAAARQAESNLAVAGANLLKAKAQNDRIAALGEVKAVSELDVITADATLKQAEAEVEAAKARVEAAHIDLAYATVRAPISGRVGRSLVTEGALVGEGEATHLTTIQQIEPIYASFTQSAANALTLRSSYANKSLGLTSDNAIPVRLILEDGSRYAQPGRLLFGEVNVDPGTGQITFRAEIPNPDGMLLPGMYVRVLLEQASFPDSYLIPQKAVSRTEHGDTVLVVGEDDVVAVRPVTIVGEQNNHWIIAEGLQSDERIMIDSFFKAPPGTEVTPELIASASAVIWE